MPNPKVLTPTDLGASLAVINNKVEVNVDGITIVRAANVVVNHWHTVTAPTNTPAATVVLPVNSPSRRAYGACWLVDGELWAYGQNANGASAGQNSALEHNRTPTAIPHNAMTFGDTPVGRTPTFVRHWANRQGILLLDDQGKLWYRGTNYGRQSGIGVAAAGDLLEQPTILDFFVTNNLTVVDAWLSDGDADDNYASGYAVTSTGALYVWGRNNYGQLGIGNTTDTATPTLASAPFGGSAVVQIHTSPAGGANHAAALLANGKLFVCGYNANGELGIGSAVQQNTWVQSYVGAAYVHCTQDATFLIDAATGKVWCTGWNAIGWFGRNNTTSGNAWVQSTSFTGVAKLVCCNGYGRRSIYILDDAGNLWVGGGNEFSQLGLGGGSAAQQNNHVKLTAAQASFQTKAKDVQCAGQNGATAYVITTDGQLWSVGYNAYGQRGLGNRQDDAAYRSKWRQVGVKNAVVAGRIFGFDDSCTIVALDDKGKLRTCGWDAQMINPLGNWSSSLYSIN